MNSKWTIGSKILKQNFNPARQLAERIGIMADGYDRTEGNKKCEDHSHSAGKGGEHDNKLMSLDEKMDKLDTRISSLEGKFSMFTWIAGSLLTVLIGMSLYSIIQLNSFKEQYYRDVISDRDSRRVEYQRGYNHANDNK